MLKQKKKLFSGHLDHQMFEELWIFFIPPLKIKNYPKSGSFRFTTTFWGNVISNRKICQSPPCWFSWCCEGIFCRTQHHK